MDVWVLMFITFLGVGLWTESIVDCLTYNLLDKREVLSLNQMIMRVVFHVTYKACKVSLSFQYEIVKMSFDDGASLCAPFLSWISFFFVTEYPFELLELKYGASL